MAYHDGKEMHYVVTWAIDVEGDKSPLQAAEEALAAIQDGARCFEVTDQDGHSRYVDLSYDAPVAVDEHGEELFAED